MHPIEERIVKSFHFVKRDIEQLQKAYLAFDKTQIKVLDTIAMQDKQLHKQAAQIDDLKVRLQSREVASTKRKMEVDKKVKSGADQISTIKKSLAEAQKQAKQAIRDVERLSKKVEKLVAKKATVKKATVRKGVVKRTPAKKKAVAKKTVKKTPVKKSILAKRK